MSNRLLILQHLEGFDHLYRFANLLETEQELNTNDLTCRCTEITPRRPTIIEPKHSFDKIRHCVLNIYFLTVYNCCCALNSSPSKALFSQLLKIVISLYETPAVKTLLFKLT